MNFASEYDIAEAALDAYSRSVKAISWPHAGNRIRQAREARGLKWESVANHVGEFYSPDIESKDDEVFSVPTVEEILLLAEVLNTSLDYLLFVAAGEVRIPKVPFDVVIAKLKARLANERLSSEQLEDIIGWYTETYFADPEQMITLPIFGLRAFCVAAGVDWLDVLPATRRKD